MPSGEKKWNEIHIKQIWILISLTSPNLSKGEGANHPVDDYLGIAKTACSL